MRLVFVLDCLDPETLAGFWTKALGYRTSASTDPYVVLVPPGDARELPEILLQRVPEPKVVKNRMHLDMRVEDIEAEALRLESLGARRLSAEPVEEDGFRWNVMADPEGNEFCVCAEPPEIGRG